MLEEQLQLMQVRPPGTPVFTLFSTDAAVAAVGLILIAGGIALALRPTPEPEFLSRAAGVALAGAGVALLATTFRSDSPTHTADTWATVSGEGMFLITGAADVGTTYMLGRTPIYVFGRVQIS